MPLIAIDPAVLDEPCPCQGCRLADRCRVRHETKRRGMLLTF
jgi:hypothetical protein